MTALQALVTERVGPASGADLAAAGDALAAAAAADLEWLMAQAEQPCSAPYRDAVARHLAAYRDLGAAVAAIGRGTGPESDVTTVIGEVETTLDLVLDTLEAALPACGVTVRR
jgi:hypothetical protein